MTPLLQIAQNAQTHDDRGTAVQMLGVLGVAAGRPGLEAVLQDDNSAYVRWRAAEALGRLGDAVAATVAVG